MAANPRDHKPAANFDAEMQVEPPLSASEETFRMALYSDNNSLLGYMGVSSFGYAEIVSKDKAAIIERYPYILHTYYRIRLSYLSVSSYAYVGWYLWGGATGWTLQPDGKFTSDWNGQNLSYFSASDGYLYAWNAYPQLIVRFEAV